MWSGAGVALSHSMEGAGCNVNVKFRVLTRDSHIMNTNIMIERNEISEPKEDTEFQKVKASG